MTSTKPADLSSESLLLGARDEAGRLWQGAQAARRRAASDLIALCESLDLGVRAAEILLSHELQAVKDSFPATIGLHLKLPPPEVEPYRDAVNTPRAMEFTDLLDLLSDPELECVSPRLHRGWEDRWAACGRSRTTASAAIGLSLDKESRDQLLLLAAYRNRIFRYPPPVRIDTKKILDAYPALEELMSKASAVHQSN